MGRKIVWQVFLLVAVLAALYGQQEIFAQEDAQAICEEEEKEPEEGEEQGEEQEKEPPLSYEVSYEEPDGEEDPAGSSVSEELPSWEASGAGV